MQLSRFIDHTLLRPEASLLQVEQLCHEAIKFHFFSVCVNSSYVAHCAQLLANTDIKVCSVIGFPLGAMTTESKAFEAREAIKNGANEIDMVIHIGALKELRMDYLEADIKAVVQSAQGLVVKVIIETALLETEEKVLACKAAQAAGAQFVKTSTGFSGGGATVEDVKLMRSVVGPEMGVKASGGVKDAAHAHALISAGASRLGTSSGVAIVLNQPSQGAY